VARWRVLVALVLVALSAAACSDDDDGSGATGGAGATQGADTAADAAPGTTGGDAGAQASSTTTAPSTTTTVDAEAAGRAQPSDRVPVPTLEGPVTGGTRGIHANPMPPGLAADASYTDEEYFVSGDARAHHATAPLPADGAWTVEPRETAAYRTRIIVRRPVDPAAFNGVLVVEWLNVSAGRDSDPDFAFLHPELLAAGYAYVGVSAQQVGIGGGGAILEIPGVPEEALAPLTVWDPERYGSLHHPGDAWSYDVFSQAAQAVLAHGAVDPLDGLAVDHVLAVGESQSAFRLVTYVDAVHPVADVFDGFLIHSRGSGGAALSDDAADAVPPVVAIRTDLAEPVLQFETETDLVRLGFVAARQPDTATVATWEVAGTAHADQSTLDYGAASGAAWDSPGGFDPSAMCGAVNTGPQGPVLRAALAALRAWVVEGTPPPPSPRLEVTGGAIARDADGIAIGGIRTPPVDAPVATLSGVTEAESVFCSLFGTTVPFSAERLAARYASTADHVAAVEAAADRAVREGFLLPVDRDAMVADARSVAIPA
jgi:hypothetical protein